MLRPGAAANAVTTMMVIAYVVCASISLIAPGFLLAVSQSWVHSLNIQLIAATSPMTFGLFILGLFSLAFLTWIVTYTTVRMYRYFVHREETVGFHRGYTTA